MRAGAESQRSTAPAWRLFVLVLLLVLTVPRMWQRGMFLDGITYAVIARNLAMGEGSFWAPSFSSTTYREFFEQPPLAFALQGALFAVAGDHFAVERVYAVAVFLANGLLIAAIWRRLLRPDYDWLPVLIWVAPSVVTWAVINNMLENTQSLFASLACYLVLRSADLASRHASAALGASAALAVVGAVLVKGPVGLFPVALPGLLLILSRAQRPRHPVQVWTGAALVLAGSAVALSAYDPSRHALEAFVRSHLMPQMAGERGIGPRGADIARHLTMGIGLRMAIVAALFWMARRFRAPLDVWREAGFFLAVACAASVPVLASPVLVGHYFVPSTPFFALAFGAMALPAAAGGPAPGPVARRLPYVFAGTLAALAVGVLLVHGPIERRDVEMVRSLDAIAGVAPRGETVGVCPASRDDWGLQSYLQRFYRISVDPSGQPRAWFVASPGACAAPASCRPAVEASRFTLYRCAAAKPGALGEHQTGGNTR